MENPDTDSSKITVLKLIAVCLLCIGIIYGLVLLIQWITA
jgi:hypothetical protein